MGNPRPAGGSRIYVRRITGSGTSVDNSFQEVQLTVPARGLIRRVRADVTAGTAINQVALEVREVTSGSGNDLVASYPLQSEPLDDDLSNASLFYSVAQTGSDRNMDRTGVLYIAVKVDDSTADHTVALSFDIEATD